MPGLGEYWNYPSDRRVLRGVVVRSADQLMRPWPEAWTRGSMWTREASEGLLLVIQARAGGAASCRQDAKAAVGRCAGRLGHRLHLSSGSHSRVLRGSRRQEDAGSVPGVPPTPDAGVPAPSFGQLRLP